MTVNQAKKKLKKIVDNIDDTTDVLSEICEEFEDDTLCSMLGEVIEYLEGLISGDRTTSISEIMDYMDEELVEKKDED